MDSVGRGGLLPPVGPDREAVGGPVSRTRLGRHGRPVIPTAYEPAEDSAEPGAQGRAPALEAAPRPGRDRREARHARLDRSRGPDPLPTEPAPSRRRED